MQELFIYYYSILYSDIVYNNIVYKYIHYIKLLFDECHWDFDGNCIKHVDYFWEYRHFYYVDSTNP
jgi:hypothetical protein